MFYNCLIIKIVYISFNMLLNVITAFTAGDTDSSRQIIDDIFRENINYVTEQSSKNIPFRLLDFEVKVSQ